MLCAGAAGGVGRAHQRDRAAGLTGPGPHLFRMGGGCAGTPSTLSLFDDFFTSTIDGDALASAVLQLTERGAAGLLNVASCEVAHKKRFIEALATEMGVVLDWATIAKVGELPVKRGDGLGLDVARAESLLGYKLPDVAAVTKALVAAWRTRQ